MFTKISHFISGSHDTFFDKKRRPPAITADSRKEKARAYAQAHQVSSVFNYLLSTSISIGLKWNPLGNANSPIVIISWFSCRYFLIPLNIILPPNISGFLRKRCRSMRFIIPHGGPVFFVYAFLVSVCLCFSWLQSVFYHRFLHCFRPNPDTFYVKIDIAINMWLMWQSLSYTAWCKPKAAKQGSHRPSQTKKSRWQKSDKHPAKIITVNKRKPPGKQITAGSQ